MLHRWDDFGIWAADPATLMADVSYPAHADQDVGRRDLWHDPVTGLPRPSAFLKRLEQALAMSGRASPIAVVVIEIVDFWSHRARLGEAGLDELLRIIAERLHEEVPEPGLVTRLKEGRFAAVLRALGADVTAEALATRLLELAREPCRIEGELLSCGAVAALAYTGDSEETPLALIERVTRAAGRAKLRSGHPVLTA